MADEQWISVKDKLPDEGESVIVAHLWEGKGSLSPPRTHFVWFAKRGCAEATIRWERADGLSADYKFYGNVTHWMPLPNPPTGETRGDHGR